MAYLQELPNRTSGMDCLGGNGPLVSVGVPMPADQLLGGNDEGFVDQSMQVIRPDDL